MSVCKKELINLISDRSGVYKYAVKDVLNAFTDVMTELFIDGEDVVLPYFGHFYVRPKMGRMYYDCNLKKVIKAPDRDFASFKGSPTLHKLLNDIDFREEFFKNKYKTQN